MEDNQIATTLVAEIAAATAASPNESNLRHECERALQKACEVRSIPWTPYQLDRTLIRAEDSYRFVDVIHGNVVIEYERPHTFRRKESSAALSHARQQAEEYTTLVAAEEGRSIIAYSLVVWDGGSISFGQFKGANAVWKRLQPFDHASANTLLTWLAQQPRPLVSPSVLKSFVGLESIVGQSLVPNLFKAVLQADKSRGRTYLLFREWRRLFGQAVGINTERLEALLEAQELLHGQAYRSNVPAYLFSLHTYLALVAKLVAALALPKASQDVLDRQADLRQRIDVLESGELFEDSGVANMLAGDFFSWVTSQESWSSLCAGIEELLERLGSVSFDVTQKNPQSVRDLFKGVYEVFVPRELRHALGEVYTPDWLAAYAIDRAKWTPKLSLLDPTCGSGTFLLEAIKRRLASNKNATADVILKGLFGIDLNPLAVLAAKASVVVTLAPVLNSERPVALPIYLADAINVATPDQQDIFRHTLQTELGPRLFAMPGEIVRSRALFALFQNLRRYVTAGYPLEKVWDAIQPDLTSFKLTQDGQTAVRQTIQSLLELHSRGWDGIWCSVLADRFAAGGIGKVARIVGNPPWVKWSHLPPEYAKFIKPLCKQLNVFSEDTYVGGIESDISTVITARALEMWLAKNGYLAFLITATVFSNESSQGFRRMRLLSGEALAQFLCVEELQEIAPFEGVTNNPSLMILRQGKNTNFPIPWYVWKWRSPGAKRVASTNEFLTVASKAKLLASPIPGSDAGPWLRGTSGEHRIWNEIFDASSAPQFQARKGITTDLNGVYFVRTGAKEGTKVQIENDPSIGRTGGIAVVRKAIETEHVFPLIRGRGVQRFSAEIDPDFSVIVPQRGMHGDPSLPTTAPATYSYLAKFEKLLRARGSYRRYQSAQPFWSTWSTGPYTFAAYKVLWKEMSGRRFCAAYIGSATVKGLGKKVVVPDHKLYFVPVCTLNEAQFLTAILNAATVSRAVSAYAAQLSLGTSVIENLRIPKFRTTSPDHVKMATLAAKATAAGGNLSSSDEQELDRLALKIVRL